MQENDKISIEKEKGKDEKMQDDVIFSVTAGTLAAKIQCEIDHHTARRIRERIDERLISERPNILVLDFSAVTFMDSSGLGLIMGRYALVRQYGGTLAVLDPSPAVLKIIRLAGMDRMVSVLRTKAKD